MLAMHSSIWDLSSNVPDPADTFASTASQVVEFIIYAAHQRCLLLEEKSQDIRHLATGILSSSQVSNRQLAQVASKMIAAAPAVPSG